MDTFIPGFDFGKWSPDKSDLTRWYYDLAKYLKDHPIPGDDTLAKIISDYLDEHPIVGDFYGPDNQPPYPVTSVNGQTGAVVIESGGGPSDAYTPGNPPPYPVTSVNGQRGAVTVKTTDVINGGTPEITAEIYVDESEDYPDSGSGGPSDAYTPSNPPPYPVTSVNGQTGAVTIDVSGGPSDAYTPSNPPPYPVTSVNGQTGAVTIEATGGPSDAYTPSNPPPYPVTSVNGSTGAVTIDAYTPTNPPPYPVTSVNGQTGAVTISGGAVSIDSVYPVGSIYMSVNSANPSTLFGGTWAAIEGKFLLGVGGGYSGGDTGGAASHSLPLGNNGFAKVFFDQPKARLRAFVQESPVWTANRNANPGVSVASAADYSEAIPLFGATEAGDTMPPYLAVYIWQRVS